MAEGTSFYLQWSLPNFITVVSMVALMSILVGLVASGIGQTFGAADN